MDLIDDPRPGENAPEFSVTELSGAVKRVIEGEFGRVRVRGEVGRVFQARSGHLYFDIKDDRSVLAAVSWKGQVASLTSRPEEGMEIIATGRMTTFGSQSKYQLNVEDVQPAGEGALMAMLEKRKKALAAEGLFEDARKRPLPFLPEVIGVVTSPSGAVIRDILHRLRDRFPRKVLVWPVAVQGAACAPEVTRAIEGFNALEPGGPLPRPDLLIVARGGGSIEDLWGFNEESVARAAAASRIPLISAVGHETDTTLIDFVSDRRAPTPTAAAELAVPVRLDLLAWTRQQGARLARGAEQAVGLRGQRLRDVARALPRPETLTESARQRLDWLSDRLPRALSVASGLSRQRLVSAAASLRPALLARRIADDRRRLGEWEARLTPALGRARRDKAARLASVASGLRLRPLQDDIARKRDRLQALGARFADQGARDMTARRDRLAALDRLRETLGYRATLDRGYAVVRGEGGVITTAKAAKAAQRLEIEFADGRMEPGAGAPARTTRKGGKPPPEQGDLF